MVEHEGRNMSELIDRERFSADMRDFQNRVGIWRDEAEDTETRTRADAALATIIETKLILDKQPTVPAPRWHRVEEPPKKTAKYLVWVDVNNGVFAAYPELRTASYNVVYERWYVDGDQRTEWIGTPRYWMPIEPPKEE